MGKIHKTAASRHEATLSPFISQFISKTTTLPLHEIPVHLTSFPTVWPFPRGDLYHWITVLNRFDGILEAFIEEYGLASGLQTRPFGCQLLTKGDGDRCTTVIDETAPTKQQLEQLGYPEDGDRELIEKILSFSAALLDNCGNRSMYASSGHLSHLLCTMSLSLLKTVLSLALRLAKRFYTSRLRYSSVNPPVSALLHSHYQLDISHLHRLAAPFARNSQSVREVDGATAKSKDKSSAQDQHKMSGADLVSILKTDNEDRSEWDSWGNVHVSFYRLASPWSAEDAEDNEPTSPSLRRQPSGSSRFTHGSSRLSSSTGDNTSTPSKPRPLSGPEGTSNPSATFAIPSSELPDRSTWEIMLQVKEDVPSSSWVELLTQVRVAKAMASDAKTREEIVGIRMLAIANLAYVDNESQFQQKIGQQDSEEPRRLQLAYQLAELVHPPESSGVAISKELQVYALWTLEALTKQKGRANDVYTALNANVNHGILFYVVRKAVAQLAEESKDEDFIDSEWREALFAVLQSLPSTAPRAGEQMMAAGLLTILVEVLNLRTVRAEHSHGRLLIFLDTFIYGVRESLQSLATASGLDAIADLTAYTVEKSYVRAEEGEGIPADYKTKMTDYQIPFYQQLTLRWLFKFVNHTMTHNSGNLNRQLRNMIESPQVLGALRQVLANAPVYGSNVWSGAVNILSNYIHNEPTSYQVIAEARLSETFLKAVAGGSPSDSNGESAISGILPAAEAIQAVPAAFGAICLNENGFKVFEESAALESFFRMFESMEHIKGIELEVDMANMLGGAFDELIRHQPALKDRVLRNIRNMVARVGKLCYDRAAQQGVGTKLWKTGSDGRLYVAGGRRALLGLGAQPADSNGDVAMTDNEPLSKAKELSSNEVSIDDVVEAEDNKSGQPTTMTCISVVCRFLTGFFSNKGGCQAFIEGGGLEDLLDYANLPCLPHYCENPMISGEEWARAIQTCIEEKPHLTLPSIVKRINAAVEILRPLLAHEAQTSFFVNLTSLTSADCNVEAASIDDGTKYAKALLLVQILCNATASTFQSQLFSQRSQSNLFYQVNLADMYVEMIDGLGLLQRSCVWEEVLLQKSMPSAWDSQTRVASTGLGDDEADQILGISLAFRSQETNGVSLPAPTATNGTSDQTSTAQATSTSLEVDQNTAAFKNTRVLRSLLSQVPVATSPLFQSLGRILLIRRISDSYQKSNAFRVADRLASSAIEQLKFEPPRQSTSLKDRFSYWIVILVSISQLMMDDALERPTPQTLTLVLQSFKTQKGFDLLTGVLDAFFEELQATLTVDNTGDASIREFASTGTKILLQLFNRIINGRNVVDASQTQAMQSRSHDRDKPDFFSPPQFLVELRMAIIKPTKKLWESNILEKATTPLVKNLIEILKTVLECEHEDGAFRRSDKLPRRVKPEWKKWHIKFPEPYNRLKDEFDENLAREAMFRCYENPATAREYCTVQRDVPGTTRNPIPPNAMQSGSNTPERPGPSTLEASIAEDVPPPVSETPLEAVLMDLAGDDSPLTPAIPALSRQLLDSLHSTPDRSPAPSRQELLPATQLPDLVTVDDLDDERKSLRGDLVDRCLDVLNAHGDLSFDLGDLMISAGSKERDRSFCGDAGVTLLNSLISLQIDDDLSPESFKEHVKKVSSCAHLLALVLQDNHFYKATLEELKINFVNLIEFIKAYPEEKMRDVTPWIGQILLVLEKLLSDDAQPREITWDSTGSDDAIEDVSVAEVAEPLIPYSEKKTLFQAVIDYLPHIGKDEALAISICRILVIVTRQRDIAVTMGTKQNLSRFFTMIRQLGSFASERLQSSVLLILRHIIEDEETIRQIMRSEIAASFEGRQRHQVDTTGYVRALSHLVIRNPEIFVECTNERVMLVRYDAKHGPQVLTLKKEDTFAATNGDTAGNKALDSEKVTASDNGKAKVLESPSKGSETRPTLEHTKTWDMKLPVVDNPDEVIHFLITELLNYREVDDPKPNAKAKEQQDKPADASSTDIEMSGTALSTEVVAPPLVVPAEGDKIKKPDFDFKSEDHPIYVYRCFLLQCLSELLSCYNRTKLEFINYKRRSDSSMTTPSKPRSFVLNYLMNTLIPTGFIPHPATSAEKKLSVVSTWAIGVIVSLCSKTGERGYIKPPRDLKDYEEEPDILFIRKFVLEHAIRSFRDAHTSTERLDFKYSRLLGLADLFHRMLTGKPNSGNTPMAFSLDMLVVSQKMMAKIMYEKNFIAALTASIADIDLNFPDAKRVVKYILRPLKLLTQTAVELSMHSDIAVQPGENDDDEISSASSISDMDDTREETPDLFRNSALGILDPRRDDEDQSSSDEEEVGDEEMYDEDYGEEMDFEDESRDPDEVISDDDDEIEGMGPIEGLPGDVDMNLSVDIVGPGGVDVEEDDSDDEEDMDDDESFDEDGEDMDLEEVDDEDGEIHDIGADDEEWGTDDEGGDDYDDDEDILEDEPDVDGPILADLLPINVGGSMREVFADEAGIDIGNGEEDPDDYPEDDVGEDDDDEEEDYEEEDIVYEPDLDDDEESRYLAAAMPWDWDGPGGRVHHDHRHHHHHHHIPGHHMRMHPWGLFGMPGGSDRPMSSYRTRPHLASQRPNDDGTNPLLQRSGRTGGSSRRRGGDQDWSNGLEPSGSGRLVNPNDSSPVAFISNLLNQISRPGGMPPAGTIHLHVDGIPVDTNAFNALAGGPPGFGAFLRAMGDMPRPADRDGSHPMRHARDDPASSVAFVPSPTAARWSEEARLLFGSNTQEKATLVINAIMRLLVPPARREQKRRDEEEAEKQKKAKEEREAAQKAKEEKEQKEREEREAQEKREREAREAAEAQAAREQAEAATTHAGDSAPAQAMEGVEQTEATEGVESSAGPSEQPRVITVVRGQEINITGLGIDPSFLEEIPEEFREEVLLSQIAQVRAEQAQNRQNQPQQPTGESSTALQAESVIPPDFLEQLPDEIREELIQQEALERRRREREEARRRQAASGAAPRAEEMDPASFFATLDPALRQDLLMNADEDTLAALPPDLAAEARALGADRRLHHFAERVRRQHAFPPETADEQAPKKSRPVVQILDKAGVATLLRLMFIHQQGSAKQSLNGILRDVCANKQNRAEVVSILLLILQDGSSDVGAVERSFAQLTLRAKNTGLQKTPQPKKSITDVARGTGEMSPLMVVQQCLSALVFLTQYNKSISEFFLKEHEMGSNLKARVARKSKGKEKETQYTKYPLNALLNLLDRKLVIESSPVMEQLASLLANITYPLLSLQKRKKEEAEEAAKGKEKERENEVAATDDATAGQSSVAGGEIVSSAEMTSEPQEQAEAPQAAAPTEVENTEPGQTEAENNKEDQVAEKKKPRVLETTPEVPEENLRLVVNIIAARECSSKTFKDTLSLITHLSTIPGAKEVFGKELIRQAQELGNGIHKDLEELLTQIRKASSGTEIQGIALARFSPASSEQAKLLRVITALDYLFDPKRAYNQVPPNARITEGLGTEVKEDMLTTLYENNVFGPLWARLSQTLTAIRERGNMFNVATILLPLIEVLMVVCKNTTLKDAPLANSQPKGVFLSSPPPEDKMKHTFFQFTEDHRKILNDLVRHNPKLMSGSFSLLVKNSKVLEFDNKRNFFNRKLHSRGSEGRQPHPSLQLSVRREDVFRDSFKSLYYKKPDEFKYGKLNIRFIGEEGVDAGGVTREWFQALAKQMFDPNYALFNPVASDRTTFHPNPESGINEEHTTFFKFVGRIIGKALYENRVLDCHFSRAVYKRMLGKSVSVKDMETLDLDYYKSLVWMLENDITDIITETFSVETEAFGETRIVDLIENGRNVSVTEENKQEYVQLVVEHKMIGSVKEQLEYFLTGFHDIVPAELIAIFNEQELELLISGLPDIDVDDWKNNSDYHNYQASSPQIQWFWRAVRSFDKEERAKLLQFVTGTSKVPLNGFKELEGMNGVTRFNIHRDYGSKDRLPSSHTCFNQLDLPEYENYEQLRKAVYTAMTAGSDYFGFA